MSQESKAGTGPVPRLGAWVEAGAVHWRAWAPEHRALEVVLHDRAGQPGRALPMAGEPGGYFHARLEGAGAGTLYKLRVDGEGPFPDPWSHAQPLGVHGPSEVVDHAFSWSDAGWRGRRMEDLVLYEVHVGTATPEGTFDALIPRLRHIRELGANALELMPLSSFPGERNWGYDGVTLNAPAHVYGGPEGLKRLVDAAHREGLAVIVDAVYNHFGPDGNYLRAYSPHYFTAHHHTPWGDAVNYDNEGSHVVRELVLRNAELWIRDYHADGLRLDAAHAIVDDTRPHLLTEIVRRARAAAGGRDVVVIAEDERNEQRLVLPEAEGGVGLDGVWADDLHHQLRRAFAGDDEGYYRDYTGSARDIARTLERGWFYEGQKSENLGHARGTPAEPVRPWSFVHCIQNHDQVGNRATGERLHDDVTPAAYRAMSALLLLSPYTPLLFMGQEWNASTPFLYFTHHNAELGKLVTEGRRKEFQGFKRFAHAEVPDPQAADTFARSKLDWGELEKPQHAGVLALYRELLALRAREPALKARARGRFSARPLGEGALLLERMGPDGARLHAVVNLRGPLEYRAEPRSELVLWTEDARFGGEGRASPLRDGVLRLEGPSAAVLRVTR